MVLLRHLLGDALRRLRLRQGRTLREVSATARVSLGYLSEVERGRKEASSELLASICDALGAPLSQVLREVSDGFALAELQNEPAFGVPFEPALAGRPKSERVAGSRASWLAVFAPRDPATSVVEGPGWPAAASAAAGQRLPGQAHGAQRPARFAGRAEAGAGDAARCRGHIRQASSRPHGHGAGLGHEPDRRSGPRPPVRAVCVCRRCAGEVRPSRAMPRPPDRRPACARWPAGCPTRCAQA